MYGPKEQPSQERKTQLIFLLINQEGWGGGGTKSNNGQGGGEQGVKKVDNLPTTITITITITLKKIKSSFNMRGRGGPDQSGNTKTKRLDTQRSNPAERDVRAKRTKASQ